MVSITASVSRFSSSRSAMRLRTSARSAGELRLHFAAAACAASSASSTSALPERATSQSGLPVIGVTLVKYCPLAGGR